MVASFVQLNTGTGGAKAQTVQNTVGGNVVDANAVVLHDAAGLPITTLPVSMAAAPAVIADSTATGTITVTDAVVAAPAGAGAFVTGASTAGSLVAIACRGSDSIWNCQVTGLTTGTLWFEGSLDSTNGTDGSWIVLNGLRDGILASIIQQSATANGMYSGNVAGLAYLRIRSVGALTGTPAVRWRLSSGTSEVYLASSIPPGTNALGLVAVEGTKAAYSAGTFAVVPAAAPQDIANIVGSATKIVRVRRIIVAATATAATTMGVYIMKRTVANTGGTRAAQLIGAWDSTDAAATATVGHYTVNPTAYGAGTNLRSFLLNFTTTAGPIQEKVIDFTTFGGKPMTLRGVGESLAINFAAQAVPAGTSMAYSFEWTEE